MRPYGRGSLGNMPGVVIGKHEAVDNAERKPVNNRGDRKTGIESCCIGLVRYTNVNTFGLLYVYIDT